MWDMLILNSSVQNSSRRKNYMDLLAAENARKESHKDHHPGRTLKLLGRVAGKIHF